MMKQSSQTYPKGFDKNKDDAGSIHDWLVSRGVKVKGVTTTPDEVIIETEDDEEVDLADYVSPHENERNIRDELRSMSIGSDPKSLRDVVLLMKEILEADQ